MKIETGLTTIRHKKIIAIAISDSSDNQKKPWIFLYARIMAHRNFLTFGGC
jgi:hypothetical protein